MYFFMRGGAEKLLSYNAVCARRTSGTHKIRDV